MLIQDKCLACIVNQAVKFAGIAGECDKTVLMRKIFSCLGQADLYRSLAPEVIGELYRVILRETGADDPFKSIREHYNRLFMERTAKLDMNSSTSAETFRKAVKYSIIGNVIDFSTMHTINDAEIDAFFARLKNKPLAIDDSDEMLTAASSAKTLLYLGDNCGEICFDKLLIGIIRRINPDCRIYFGTKGAPVVNDSVEADAYAVGMDEYAEIISNGDSSLGTVLHRTSERFQAVYNEADVIIAKGQANYECLSDERKEIFFLLMSKCEPIAASIGVKEMQMVCMKGRHY